MNRIEILKQLRKLRDIIVDTHTVKESELENLYYFLQNEFAIEGMDRFTENYEYIEEFYYYMQFMKDMQRHFGCHIENHTLAYLAYKAYLTEDYDEHTDELVEHIVHLIEINRSK